MNVRLGIPRLTCCVLVAAYGLSTPPTATAQRTEPAPDGLEGVGITEHLDVQLPLDLEFVDEFGKPVTVGDIFDGERPVILNLIYFNCPMLCSLVVNAMVDGMQGLDWTAGNEFDILTVSIDPTETNKLAYIKKQNYIKDYGRPQAVQGWHFLTGKEENIKKLADTVGFGYRYDEERGEYIHAAALFVCTPDGRTSRYLYGVEFETQTLRLALIEASEGKIGSTLDQFILYCFHYDAAKGRYAPVAMNIMRAGGVLTLIVMGIVFGGFWMREMRRKRVIGDEEVVA